MLKNILKNRVVVFDLTSLSTCASGQNEPHAKVIRVGAVSGSKRSNTSLELRRNSCFAHHPTKLAL